MMKVQIRRGVFETNSSSTHNMTICSRDEYNAWIDGKVYWTYSGNFVSKEEAYEYVRKNEDELFEQGKIDIRFDALSDEDKEQVLYDYNYRTVENWANEYFEEFEQFYTTESGDNIVVFGQFGYDG